MLFTPATTLIAPAAVGGAWTGPTSGITSQWWLDDSHVSGTTISDSGSNNNTGTAAGGVTSASSPAGAFYSTARAFDGVVGTGITLASSVLNWTSSFTLAMWVYVVDITAAGSGGFRATFFYSALSDSTHYIRVLNDTNLAAGVIDFEFNAQGAARSSASSSAVLVNNTWAHVGVTYDTTTITLYVNGSSVSTQNSSIGDASSSAVAFIGDHQAITTGDPNGRMYNIVLYNRALSSGEMSTLFSAK